MTDALGNLVDFCLMPGQAHDLRETHTLIQDRLGGHLLADRAFGADWLRKDLMDRDIVPVIPPKANRIFPAELDKETYKWRHLIENYFGKQRGIYAPMQDRPELQSLHLYRGDNPTITMNVNSP